MLAIGMEGFAFELGLALGRGGLFGCLIGGVLAMSWTLLHLLLSLLLSYGGNLIEVYRQLVLLAGQQFGPPYRPASAGPIAVLALINMSIGAAAALTGWRVGGRTDATTSSVAAAASPPRQVVPTRRHGPSEPHHARARRRRSSAGDWWPCPG